MNIINIIGKIKINYREYYKYSSELFYYTELECMRSSGVIDTLPLVISQYMVGESRAGDIVEVVGEVRSRNNNGKVEIFIFAQELKVHINTDINEGLLTGNVCKLPTYRVTPLGREITDIILAVQRLHGTDFIPCITWGRTAKYSSRFTVGDRIEVIGRLQSREHRKGVAYEVSVNQIKYHEGGKRV